MVEITNVSEVQECMHKKWAFLSGGRTASGSYIISMPDVDQPTRDEFIKILKFLSGIILDVDTKARFVIVIDKRKSKWANIKPFLNLINDKFPDLSRIEKIFMLQPTGIFKSLQKLITLLGDDSKIDYMHSTSELHKILDKSMLTFEFDGLIDFNINDWLNDVQMVDNIITEIQGMDQNLDKLFTATHATMQSLDESSSKVEEKCKEDMETFQCLRDKIAGYQSNVKASLAYMGDTLPMKDLHLRRLEKLQPLLANMKVKCHDQCEKYEAFMTKAVRLISLNEQVDQMLKKAEMQLDEIGSVKVIGCRSLDEVNLGTNSLKNFEYSIKSLTQESETLWIDVENFSPLDTSSSASSDNNNPTTNGESFTTSITTIKSSFDGDITASSTYDFNDRMSSRLVERAARLKSLIAAIGNDFQFAFQQLQKTQGAISAMDKVIEWNRKAEELVRRHSVLTESAETSLECEEAMEELKKMKGLKCVAVETRDVKSFQSEHQECLDQFVMDTVYKTYIDFSAAEERIDDLMDKLSQKASKLKKKEEEEVEEERRSATLKAKRTSKDVDDSNSMNSFDSMELPSSEESDLVKREPATFPLVRTRKFHPQAKIVVDSKIIPGMMMMHNDKNICQRLDIINASRDQYPSIDNDRQFHLIDIKRGLPFDDMEKYIPPRLREDLIGIQPVPDSGTIRRKRSHVIQELIDTERAYTSDLKNIIEGYYNQFDNPDLQELIPKGLVDKRDELFGNIKDIYAFHSEIFLRSLEACESQSIEVGKCFIENKERLQLYSIYCQNKILAERLIEKVGDNNPFFRECQKRLNHPLPFSAYILKPVQRITKYHLLLKELVRMTTNESEASDLKRAIMAICDVLRYVNNSMHQLSITGFPGNLMEQGRLLMQGSLEVSMEKRKDRGAAIKQTFHKRQVFLYDRCILFCKKKDSTMGLGSYVFKCSLKTDQVGPLVESPKGGDDRRFELWSKNEVWSFISSTPDEKLDWVEEIKKVLYEQMDLLRANNKKLHVDVVTQMSFCPIMTSNEPDSLISSDLDNISDT